MPDNGSPSSPHRPNALPTRASRFAPPLPVLLSCVLVLAGVWFYLSLAAGRGILGWLSVSEGGRVTTVETRTLRDMAGPGYQVYFTKPHYPEDGTSRVGGLDHALVADLDRAQYRIDLLTFDFDLPSVADALLRAHRRGVRVRLAVDGENLETPVVAKLTGDLQGAGVPVSLDRRSAFMHNKIILIDERIVWTGSWNLTVNDTFRNNNNMVRIDDEGTAIGYGG
jgi:phosphatidylserine/phosphatidylglycerophosphate/cardiolipin synthase-like enzyme